jgi:phage repressor protein C with HTH and peptisase S24 domain
MLARVVQFPSRPIAESGEYSLLSSELPGKEPQILGVLLLEGDRLHIRLRRDWKSVASEEDAEVLAELEEDLQQQAQELGGKAVLERLEKETSNALRITDREAVHASDFGKLLNELYRKYVPASVLKFRTHLPHYSLAVAAGPFLTNPEDIGLDEWIEAPPDLKLDEDMFVARIAGHSMEPRIPDGSLCVFRRNVVGSRNGRLVLVRNTELADDNQYTVKRYRSEKVEADDGLLQTCIRLESLNPAYPSWDLDQDQDKYQVVAEFIRVLE